MEPLYLRVISLIQINKIEKMQTLQGFWSWYKISCIVHRNNKKIINVYCVFEINLNER